MNKDDIINIRTSALALDPGSIVVALCDDLVDSLTRGRDLEKALEFYGDSSNYQSSEPDAVEGNLETEWAHYPSVIYVDNGLRARLTLGLDPTEDKDG